MDNKYTFKDFLADLKQWQSENLVEYYLQTPRLQTAKSGVKERQNNN